MRNREARKLLIEPPSSAMGDIAFNLIVFFLVCASVQPDSGRRQDVPRSENKDKQEQAEHIEVRLTRTTAVLNGDALPLQRIPRRLRQLLANKPRAEDRIVVVKSNDDTPYQHWIEVTGMIEEAGGVITIQREEEREIQLPSG